jgi:uncharacterized protein YegP (UPF0339 family)
MTSGRRLRGRRTAELLEVVLQPAPDTAQGSRGEFRFHLKAGNGEVIASSEGYASKASALNGIESAKRNAPNATVDDLS